MGTDFNLGLSRSVVEEMVSCRNEDGLVRLVLDFLAGSVAGGGTDAQDHAGGFVGETFCPDAQDDRMAFWRFVLRRCDTNASLGGYVVKCFQHYCSKQKCKENREYAALYSIINRSLKNGANRNTVCMQVVPSHGKRQEVSYYGLTTWSKTIEQVGIFDGDWAPVKARDDRDRITHFSLNHKTNGNYDGEDVIAACALLLELAGQYCRASILSFGISTFWVKCNALSPERTISIDEELEIGHEYPAPSTCDDSYAFDVYPIVVEFVEDHFERRELTVIYNRLLVEETERKTLHELGELLEVSHVTVTNIEKRAIKRLLEWRDQWDREELRDICRVLPEVVKKTIAAKSGCISSKRLLISQLYQRYS